MSEMQLSGGIMVIGAHAGDAENMAAAVVLKHTRAGFPATIVHLTLGEAGHPRMAPAEYAEQRKREVAESARLMGAEVVWLPYPDGLLPVNDEVKFQVCDLIRQKKPAVNPDPLERQHPQGPHRRLRYRPGRRLLRGTARHPAQRPGWSGSSCPLGEGAVPGELGGYGGFRADLYLDVSEVWEDYLEVLCSHEFIRGGISTFRYFDYYSALGITRGCLAGNQRAVALMAPDGSWLQRVDYLPGLEPKGG